MVEKQYQLWNAEQDGMHLRVNTTSGVEVMKAMNEHVNDDYAYVLEWADDGQCKFVWGTLSGSVHNNDTREMVWRLLNG